MRPEFSARPPAGSSSFETSPSQRALAGDPGTRSVHIDVVPEVGPAKKKPGWFASTFSFNWAKRAVKANDTRAVMRQAKQNQPKLEKAAKNAGEKVDDCQQEADAANRQTLFRKYEHFEALEAKKAAELSFTIDGEDDQVERQRLEKKYDNVVAAGVALREIKNKLGRGDNDIEREKETLQGLRRNGYKLSKDVVKDLGLPDVVVPEEVAQETIPPPMEEGIPKTMNPFKLIKHALTSHAKRELARQQERTQEHARTHRGSMSAWTVTNALRHVRSTRKAERVANERLISATNALRVAQDQQRLTDLELGITERRAMGIVGNSSGGESAKILYGLEKAKDAYDSLQQLHTQKRRISEEGNSETKQKLETDRDGMIRGLQEKYQALANAADSLKAPENQKTYLALLHVQAMLTAINFENDNDRAKADFTAAINRLNVQIQGNQIKEDLAVLGKNNKEARRNSREIQRKNERLEELREAGYRDDFTVRGSGRS